MPMFTSSRADGLTIGELAKRTGVNIETIRYYERIDLLPPPPRTPSGRRSYAESHVQVLAFIRRGRELGFPIADIRTLLRLAEPDDTSCAEVESIARAHLDSVRSKIADLMRLERLLSETVSQCGGDGAPSCPVLDVLNASDR
ncbi:MAG: helix-turn-helix domain-containing protein [Alphaproteobacteria bacterium]|nr:helix-turn-helix domain-containing protein [Alphaproteobacteria bacterium]MCB9931488.1 helix-turn-helix domain-containing protein [Alphaproteobacteria bacterium]